MYLPGSINQYKPMPKTDIRLKLTMNDCYYRLGAGLDTTVLYMLECSCILLARF